MSAFLQLILGGARSGKSRFALTQGGETGFEPRLFLATASPGDEEMRQRIDRHRSQRGSEWQTLEEPYHLVEALGRSAVHPKGLVIVDCATLWISNLLCGMGGKAKSAVEIEKEFEKLVQIFPLLSGNIRIVSNEVGLGVVPDNLLSRQFRDLQGTFNQSVASIANQVILLTAGIPQKIK
ncbi:MAG TPA: bifunctional adenosylcobinamide kinase/adenosylcobinamide-phosphate guanylyltransferase [bacterium]|nr:bifunctional adenosylcobinamide kinase/adenosylcobinamide-phosphate guanylyltransferase [bacterium]